MILGKHAFFGAGWPQLSDNQAPVSADSDVNRARRHPRGLARPPCAGDVVDLRPRAQECGVRVFACAPTSINIMIDIGATLAEYSPRAS